MSGIGNLKRVTGVQNVIRAFLIAFVLIQPFFDCYYFYTEAASEVIGFTIPPMFSVFWAAIMLTVLVFGTFKEIDRKSVIALAIYLVVCLIYFVIHHITTKDIHSVSSNGFDYSMIHEAYYTVRLLIPAITAFLVYNVRITKNTFYTVIWALSALISVPIVLSNIFVVSLSSYTNQTIKASFFEWFFNSGAYSAVELTSKGFFSYANQISAIMLMLFPIMLYCLVKKFKILTAAAVMLHALSMILIGTKTAAYGLILELIVFAFIMLFCTFMERKPSLSLVRARRGTLITLAICVAFSAVLLPFSPVLKRQNSQTEFLLDRTQKEFDVDSDDKKSEESYYNLSFDERVKYIGCQYNNYSISNYFITKSYPYENDPDFWYEILNRPIEERLNYRIMETRMIKRVVDINDDPMDFWFGISATREVNIFKIERDYLSQFYSMGLIGVIVFLMPFVLLIPIYFVYTLYSFVKKRSHLFRDLTLLMSVSVGLLSAYITGNCLDGLFMTVVLGFISGYMVSNITGKAEENDAERKYLENAE